MCNTILTAELNCRHYQTNGMRWKSEQCKCGKRWLRCKQKPSLSSANASPTLTTINRLWDKISPRLAHSRTLAKNPTKKSMRFVASHGCELNCTFNTLNEASLICYYWDFRGYQKEVQSSWRFWMPRGDSLSNNALSGYSLSSVGDSVPPRVLSEDPFPVSAGPTW